MQTKKPGVESEWVDPEDAPHLTKEWFERADFDHRVKTVRRGEVESARSKEAVNLRLDADVSDYFRQTGPTGRAASTKRCARRRGSSG